MARLSPHPTMLFTRRKTRSDGARRARPASTSECNEGLMGKSKRGRPARPGLRYPGGKLKGEPADAVAKWKRARILAEAQVIDPRWGSSIAQLVFFRRL